MEVDALDFELENNEEAPATQKQFQGLPTPLSDNRYVVCIADPFITNPVETEE